MTRDEAIDIYGSACWPDAFPMGLASRKQVGRAIDALVKLGILKLDEPKTAWQKFNEIVADWIDPIEQGDFFTDIERAGLKIVEK